MRIEIILIILILACLPFRAFAGCPTGTGGIDPLADVGMTGGDPSFSTALHTRGVFVNTDSQDASVSTSSKPRVPPDERPAAYPNPNPVNMSMPDPNSVRVPLSAANNSSVQTQLAVQAVTVPIRSMDFSGKWTIKLDDGQSMDLTLFQTGSNNERVMGSGYLFKGSSKVPLTASGSVSDKEAKLNLRTQVNEYINKNDPQCQYNVDMFLKNDVLSGSYEMMKDDDSQVNGNATAIKSAA